MMLFIIKHHENHKKIITDNRIMSVALKSKQLLTTYSGVANKFINEFYKFGRT